jgi:hypothetical protein
MIIIEQVKKVLLAAKLVASLDYFVDIKVVNTVGFITIGNRVYTIPISVYNRFIERNDKILSHINASSEINGINGTEDRKQSAYICYNGIVNKLLDISPQGWYIAKYYKYNDAKDIERVYFHKVTSTFKTLRFLETHLDNVVAEFEDEHPEAEKFENFNRSFCVAKLFGYTGIAYEQRDTVTSSVTHYLVTSGNDRINSSEVKFTNGMVELDGKKVRRVVDVILNTNYN